MSDAIHRRKRDVLRGWFRGSVSPEPNPTPLAIRTKPGLTASPLQRAPSAQLGQRFLDKALLELTPEEQEIIQTDLKDDSRDISSAVERAYNAAAAQKQDEAAKVLVWLDRFKSVGDIIANVNPMYVGLPWAGIRVILEVTVSESRQMAALLTGMSLALYMANRLKAYFDYFKRLPASLRTEGLELALIALYAHVLRFIAMAMQTYQKNAVTRTWQALWQISTLEDFETKSDSLASRAEAEANICDRKLYEQKWEEARTWKEDLERALQSLEGSQNIKESLALLEVNFYLSRLTIAEGASYSFSADEHPAIWEEDPPKCLAGTRIDILGKINNWVDNAGGKRIFWLCGKAGTGKSTIARTFAQSLDEQGRLGASFFFKRGMSDRGNAHLLFPTIARQLADRLQGLETPIASALRIDRDLCRKSLRTQFEKLLLEPLLDITQGQSSHSSLVLVIDALDECDRSIDIKIILSILARVESLGLRVFVTSRPVAPAQLGFKDMAGNLHQDILLEEMQVTTIEHDIRLYFEHFFLEIRKVEDALRPYGALPAEWPGEERMDQLVNLAVPLFIFPSTVCRYISGPEPEVRLEDILQHKYMSLSGIDKAYMPVLDQLLPSSDRWEQEKALSEFRELVGPIVLLADPLSALSLSRLLEITLPGIASRLRHLYPVLSIPEDCNEPIRLLHLSFRDFLVRPQENDAHRFWIDKARTHGKLAKQCVRRLGMLRHNLCNIAEPGSQRADTSKQRVADSISADVAYACRYWVWHLSESEESIYDNGYVHTFLESHFLHWLEALSWLGRLSDAITHISALQSLAKSGQGPRLSEFLEDARRFVHRNRRVADIAPLQLYLSAIVFTPSQSIVRRTFDKHISKWLSHSPTVPSHWSAEIQRLEGHNKGVTGVAFSHDGQVIASALRDKTVRLWNATTGEEIQKLEGYNPKARGPPYSSYGQGVAFSRYRLASASLDFTVRLWNPTTGEEMQRLEGHNNPVRAVAFSPNGEVVASASWDQTIRLWNVTTGKEIQKLEGHNYAVMGVDFSPDGQVVASASLDQTVRLWNATTGEEIRTLEQHEDFTGSAFSPDGQLMATISKDGKADFLGTKTREGMHKFDNVTGVAFSPDGQVVASASWDRTIRLWNATTGEEMQKLEGHDDAVAGVAFSPDGQVVASASEDETVRLWNATTGKEMQRLDGHDSEVTEVAFSPNGLVLASASYDGTVRLWSTTIREGMEKLEGHDGRVSGIGISPCGQVVASASWDQTIRLWDATTGKEIRKLKGHNGAVMEVDFSPDGQVVASASLDQTVRLWNVTTGEEIRTLVGHDGGATDVFFSSYGQIVASAAEDDTVRVWNATTGKEMQKLDIAGFYVAAMTFSPDGQVVALALMGEVESVQLWNVTTGEEMRNMGMAFSPDGQMVASASSDCTVRLWSVSTRDQIQKLQGHDREVWGVAFSPNGQVVASASMDRTVRLWNSTTGEEMKKLEAHGEAVTGVAFSPNGQVVASASSDCTVRLWNATTGEEIQKLKGHEEVVTGVAFSPDGQVVASASWDCTVRLWNGTTGEEMQKLKGNKSNFTEMAFSPDGQVVASADLMSVWIWNATTGKEMQKLDWRDDGVTGVDDEVTGIAFSLDGQVVTSMSQDWTLRQWNTRTGEEINTFHGLNYSAFLAIYKDSKSLETELAPPNVTASCFGSSSSARTSGIGKRDQWITWRNQDILWLPQEYRGEICASYGNLLVIGQRSGAMSFFRFTSKVTSDEDFGATPKALDDLLSAE